jgi:hypothetical protein
MDSLITIGSQSPDRVQKATPSAINAEIENRIWERVAQFANSNTYTISERIKELDSEWDIERWLGVNMACVALSGLAAAVATKKINWLIVPTVVLGFYLQHSIQGWCPPLPLLRKLRIRTSNEIDLEKYALKFLRGDFNSIDNIPVSDLESLKAVLKK